MPRTALLLRRATLASLAALLLAVPAFAAPVREGTVSAAAPVYTWDGGPGRGIGQGTTDTRCTPIVYECEDSLVDVKDGGDMLVEIKAGDGSNDLDVAVYASDAAGAVAADATPVAEDISTNKDAKVTARRLKAGFYVIRVRFYDAINGAYKGTATLKPAVAAAPPAPPTTPPPATTPPSGQGNDQAAARAKKYKQCRAKAKKVKNKKKRKKALKRCNRYRS